MDQTQAWDFETQYKKILFKLKLDDLSAKIESLSGGQKKRIALCNALLKRPELLILDEPTNHIDLEMIEWLEGFLLKMRVTLLMVTHQPDDASYITDQTILIADGKAHRPITTNKLFANPPAALAKYLGN